MTRSYNNAFLTNFRLSTRWTLCVGLISVSSIIYSQNGTLNITITNIEVIKGELFIAIYDKKENYLNEGMEYKKLILPVDNSIVKYTFENLPQKEYAIAVFHDVNSDGKCNRSLLGIPTEGYGFSNNINPIFSAPPFRKVKFKLDHSTSVTISLLQ